MKPIERCVFQRFNFRSFFEFADSALDGTINNVAVAFELEQCCAGLMLCYKSRESYSIAGDGTTRANFRLLSTLGEEEETTL